MNLETRQPQQKRGQVVAGLLLLTSTVLAGCGIGNNQPSHVASSPTPPITLIDPFVPDQSDFNITATPEISPTPDLISNMQISVQLLNPKGDPSNPDAFCGQVVQRTDNGDVQNVFPPQPISLRYIIEAEESSKWSLGIRTRSDAQVTFDGSTGNVIPNRDTNQGFTGQGSVTVDVTAHYYETGGPSVLEFNTQLTEEGKYPISSKFTVPIDYCVPGE